MRHFTLAAMMSMSLAGCASTPSSALASCTSSLEYVGPSPRAPLELDKFPSSKIDVQRIVTPDVSGQLDSLFTKMVKSQTDASSASIAIWHPEKGYWSSDYGTQEDKPFWWASVGKMATATIVLQLVYEKQLSLDDKLAKWLPEFPNANLITVEQLLTHTSGVFDFNTDQKFREKSGVKTVEDILKISAKHGRSFCPGTDWFYSNTGYVLLGHIAEQIEEKNLGEIVKKRISDPLSLPTFGIISPTDPADSIVAPGGAEAPSVPEIGSLYGAGAFKATPKDMMMFLSAYLEGDLTTAAGRDQALRTLYPMFGQSMNYGKGVMVFDVPDPDLPTVWVGHTGGSPNAKGLVIYDVKRRAYVAMVLNKQASAEAIANMLLKTLD